MASSSYARGRDAEYRAIGELEADGWEAVRTAGSHSKADVIAYSERGVRFIQCKTWLKKRTSHAADRKALAGLRLPPHSTAEIWGRRVGQIGWDFKEVCQQRD